MAKFEWRLLCCVSEYPGANARSLSMLALIPEEDLHGILDAMVNKSWLTRSLDETNADSYHIDQPGIDHLVPVLAAARAHEREVLKVLSLDELQLLKPVLKKLIIELKSAEHQILIRR